MSIEYGVVPCQCLEIIKTKYPLRHGVCLWHFVPAMTTHTRLMKQANDSAPHLHCRFYEPVLLSNTLKSERKKKITCPTIPGLYSSKSLGNTQTFQQYQQCTILCDSMSFEKAIHPGPVHLWLGPRLWFNTSIWMKVPVLFGVWWMYWYWFESVLNIAQLMTHYLLLIQP